MDIKQLSYDDDISVEEAEERLREVETCLKAIREHYTSKWPRFGRNKSLSEADKGDLAKLIGVLLPLGVQRSITEQYRSMMGSEESLLHKTLQLTQDIMYFMAEFENSGVKLVDQPMLCD